MTFRHYLQREKTWLLSTGARRTLKSVSLSRRSGSQRRLAQSQVYYPPQKRHVLKFLPWTVSLFSKKGGHFPGFVFIGFSLFSFFFIRSAVWSLSGLLSSRRMRCVRDWRRLRYDAYTASVTFAALIHSTEQNLDSNFRFAHCIAARHRLTDLIFSCFRLVEFSYRPLLSQALTPATAPRHGTLG